jgi:hypothetical protein
MVQVRWVFSVDSDHPWLSLNRGDKVQGRNWAVDFVKQMDDGTPLYVLTAARGFSKPTIERMGN